MNTAQLSSTPEASKLMQTISTPARLHILERLDTRSCPIKMDSLTDSLTKELVDGDPSTRDYYWSRIALTHNHLPQLEELKLVQYDDEAETVDSGAAFTSVTELRRVWEEFVTEMEQKRGSA